MQQVMTHPPLVDLQRISKWVLGGLAAILLVSISFLSLDWPFSKKSVLSELGDASQSKVEATSYHGTYFPRPGCVLEHVTFRHNTQPGAAPLITVETLRIEGSFSGLLTKHLKSIRAYGLRVLVPPIGSERFQTPARSSFVIDNLTADGANLEVATQDPQQPPLKFAFHSFAMGEVGGSGPASFQAKFSNPEPTGEITASGKFGPWNEGDAGKTPVSGKYSFQNADLGSFSGLGGILSSAGDFSGVLSHIETQGHIDAPQFTVDSSSHKVPLQTDFHAVVNGVNGDTFLNDVTTHLLNTVITSRGDVAGHEGQDGKTASIDMATQNGRIQDILLLFTKSPRAPMSGNVSFQARVSIPPGDRPFLEKVQLQGKFGIDDGAFTKSDTQANVNQLSNGALRKDKETLHLGEKAGAEYGNVLSDLKGSVLLQNGVATFSNLSFSVPGAEANMQGTFNVINDKIDLHGTLKTASEPANSTSGVKSVMLKVLEPFFKKKQPGYIMPVKITGTYWQPSFGLDLAHRAERDAHKGKASGG
jgi:hypothetical protein